MIKIKKKNFPNEVEVIFGQVKNACTQYCFIHSTDKLLASLLPLYILPNYDSLFLQQ